MIKVLHLIPIFRDLKISRWLDFFRGDLCHRSTHSNL